jgi:hypothetical protein
MERAVARCKGPVATRISSVSLKTFLVTAAPAWRDEKVPC